jgi:hypothetical protein
MKSEAKPKTLPALSEPTCSAVWTWDNNSGILHGDGSQMVQILQTAGKAARIREGKIITMLLNKYCVPNKQGRPSLPNAE